MARPRTFTTKIVPSSPAVTRVEPSADKRTSRQGPLCSASSFMTTLPAISEWYHNAPVEVAPKITGPDMPMCWHKACSCTCSGNLTSPPSLGLQSVKNRTRDFVPLVRATHVWPSPASPPVATAYASTPDCRSAGNSFALVQVWAFHSTRLPSSLQVVRVLSSEWKHRETTCWECWSFATFAIVRMPKTVTDLECATARRWPPLENLKVLTERR
mmetsp:Transcript_43499/g.124401  ORF Transcript_43499/g.124401 Transcript_43499/m.124401 type:complete len:214 (-) Transcript_43499:398-1039(-)